MGLNSFEEIGTEQNYDAIVRVVVPREVREDDYREQRALKVVLAIQESLTGCAGINLVDVRLESEAEFTLEDLRNSIEWDAYEYLSLALSEVPQE